MRDLVSGPRRFVELQRTLPGISTEQLRSRLNRMVADGLLTRQRYREVPPRVDYELTERSRELIDVIGALARWGFDWAWGAPRPGERVDIGALLRLAPALLDGSAELDVPVEMIVRGDGDHPERRYVLSTHQGRAQISEQPASTVGASISGGVEAWIAAFGPDGDCSLLEFEGARELAERVLTQLVSVSRHQAAVA